MANSVPPYDYGYFQSAVTAYTADQFGLPEIYSAEIKDHIAQAQLRIEAEWAQRFKDVAIFGTTKAQAVDAVTREAIITELRRQADAYGGLMWRHHPDEIGFEGTIDVDAIVAAITRAGTNFGSPT